VHRSSQEETVVALRLAPPQNMSGRYARGLATGIDTRSVIRGVPSPRGRGCADPHDRRDPAVASRPTGNCSEGEDRVANVEAHITGTVWKVECKVGDTIAEGDTVVILESMKMEMPVEAEDEGTVKEIRCEEGQAVSEGDVLVVLE
jgi:acetyl-CoA carboxylase biotin carboxyl carrier protein